MMMRMRAQIGALAVAALVVPTLAGCGSDRGGEGGGEGDEGINPGLGTDETAGDGDGDGGGGPLLDLGGGDGQDGDGADEGQDDGCTEVEVSVEPTIPTVVLLVDQSGSMDANFSGQERWDAVYDTLMDPDNGVVKPLESTVRFGLALYTNTGGGCPDLTEVAPALNNHGAIDTIYAPEGPEGDTPTGDSIDVVAAQLDEVTEEGPKVIVLATDGEPDTCAQPNPQEGQPEALKAAQDAFDMGIETYIISVGNDVSDTHLQEMANAGVGLDPIGIELAPFYKALDPDQLVAAFDEIIGGVISCTLEIDGIVELDQACEGSVELDGQELECGVDWELSDPSTLELLGEACATLQDGEPHTVTASWPCGAVTIP